MEAISAHLKFIGACQVENRIFFCNLAFNGIFYIDTVDYTIHYVCKFPDEPVSADRLSLCNGILYDNAIYFFPNFFNKILQYDVLGQKCQYINMGDCADNCMICSVVMKKNLVYMFPQELGQGIYIFDLNTQKVKRDKELSAPFVGGFYIRSLVCYDNCDCVLVGEYGGGRLLKLNLETKQIVFSRTFKEFKFEGMMYNAGHLWILPMDSANIFEWDETGNRLKTYINENAEYTGIPIYTNLVFLEDEILTVNVSLKNIFRIDWKKGVIDSTIAFPEDIQTADSFFSGWPLYSGYMVLDDRVLFFPCAANSLLVYDRLTKRFTTESLQISEKEVPYLREVLREKIVCGKPLVESDELGTLDQFLDHLEINRDSGQRLKQGETGKRIHRNCLM